MKPKVLVIDTEATGTDIAKDQVIELAWLEMPSPPSDMQVVNNKTANQFSARFNPDVPMNLGAMTVHHILPSDLDGLLPSSEVPSHWKDHGIDYVVAHNVDFDAEMLGGLAGAKRICTLALARFLLPHIDSHKQGAVLYHYAIGGGWLEDAREMQKEAHSALADVHMCAIVLDHLYAEARNQGHEIDTWEDLYQLSELARIPTIMGFGKYKGTPINQVDRGYVRWYRGQADTDPFYLEAFRRAGY